MCVRILLAVVMCLFSWSLPARAGVVDSLKACLYTAPQGSTKVGLLISISQQVSAKDSTVKLQFATQALELATKLNSGGRIMDCYQNLGFIYLFTYRNYRQSSSYYNEYYDWAVKQQDTTRQIEALQKLIIAHTYLTEYAKVLGYGTQALQLHPDQMTQSSILGNMGVIYQGVGDYPKAMDYFTQSLKVTEKILLSKKVPTQMDTVQLAALVYSIGDIYAKMKDYPKALNNFNYAITLGNGFADIVNMALMGKGAIFDMKGEYRSSIGLYKEALSISRSNQGSDNQIIIYISLADLYLKVSDVRLAQQYADSALAMARRLSQESSLPMIYVRLAKINIQNKKFSGAETYLKDAIKIAGKSGELGSEMDAWEVLTQTYEAMNRPADALAAYRHYIALKDTLYGIDKAREITRMGIESIYDTRRIRDSLQSVKQTAAYDVRIQKQKVVSRSAYAGLAVLLFVSFFMYRNYKQQKKANVLISLANEKISDEQQMSESLLLNILPGEVAKELKEHGDVQPKLFESVTVIFTDFANFTVAGERLSPQQLVAELHTCFKAFDLIIGKYKIEKIKTVGDAYIAVSGLPQPNANHAEDIVKAALEIRDYMLERKRQFPDNAFDIRIGVNSGPVVAGIVGVKKFAYDIWGDTVNVAARMEQNCEEGKVNISNKTYELVKGKFACTDRGKLDVKNKGEMRMYYVA